MLTVRGWLTGVGPRRCWSPGGSSASSRPTSPVPCWSCCWWRRCCGWWRPASTSTSAADSTRRRCTPAPPAGSTSSVTNRGGPADSAAHPARRGLRAPGGHPAGRARSAHERAGPGGVPLPHRAPGGGHRRPARGRDRRPVDAGPAAAPGARTPPSSSSTRGSSRCRRCRSPRATTRWPGPSTPTPSAARARTSTPCAAYVVGDDLRRVHWAATARHDDLMVRQDELPWQGRATVVIDTRAAAHTPETFERAVSAAASVVTAAARRQDLVRLVSLDGADSGFAGGHSHAEALLEHLACIEPTTDAPARRGHPRPPDRRTDRRGAGGAHRRRRRSPSTALAPWVRGVRAHRGAGVPPRAAGAVRSRDPTASPPSDPTRRSPPAWAEAVRRRGDGRGGLRRPAGADR